MVLLENIKRGLKNSPIASLILYPDAPQFTIADANDACCQIYGIKDCDIVGRGIFEAFAQAIDPDTDKRKKIIHHAFKYVLLLKTAYKIGLLRYDVRKPGSRENAVRFWNVDLYPVLDDNNNVMFVIYSIVDVTDTITSEHTKFTFDNRSFNDTNYQHPLFDYYPDAVFSLDLKGNFLSVNKVVVDLAECTEEELLRMSFIPFLDPDDSERVFGHFQDALHGNIQHFDAKLISAKGHSRILSVTNLPIVINNEVIGIYAIAKDITSRVKTEHELQLQREQLQVSNQRIADILESITDGFFAIDRNWIVTYWNKEAERLLFKSREEMMGKNLWEMFPEAIPLKFYSEYHRSLAENISIRFEEYFAVLDMWIGVSVFPSKEGLSVYFSDITEEKNNHELLSDAKEKYERLFNTSPIPTWVYDKETLKFLDVNQAAIESYGYSWEEFLSMTIKDIRPSEDVGALMEIMQHEVRFDRQNKSFVRHLKKSGEIIFVNTLGNSLPFNGRPARIVIAIDITEKMKAEELLTASEQRFKALVQDGSDLIGILDRAGTYSYVSPNTELVLGIKSEDFIGKNAFDFIHPDDIDRVLAQFNSLSSQKRISIAPFRFRDINNKYRWVETIATDMTGEPAVGGIVTNSRDVTRRIETELRIKENIDRYNTVSKATSDTIYDWDMLKNVVFWNKGLKGTFGYDKTTTTQSWWIDNVHPDDIEPVIDTLNQNIRKKKSRWQGKYRFRCADGEYKFVLDRGFMVYNADKEPVRLTGSMQDVTELENHIHAIEQQNETLREISWIQSHVVRAPLSRIMALSDLIRDNDDDALRPELLQHLDVSVNELDQVIKDIVRKTEGL